LIEILAEPFWPASASLNILSARQVQKMGKNGITVVCQNAQAPYKAPDDWKPTGLQQFLIRVPQDQHERFMSHLESLVPN
jgi:hypothetical protein